MKKISGIMKKEKLERFIGLRRIRDKDSLSPVLTSKIPDVPALPDMPAMPTDGALSKFTKMLKPSTSTLKNSPLKSAPVAVPSTKIWTSLQEPKGIEPYMNDQKNLIAMAREEVYALNSTYRLGWSKRY
jgi:hypothetical protein